MLIAILLSMMPLNALAETANKEKMAVQKTQTENYKGFRLDDQINCLGLAVYHEANNQTQSGKLAVAHTVMNRTRSGKYPPTVCGVVFQRYHGRTQFVFAGWSAKRLLPKDTLGWRDAIKVAEQVFNHGGHDPTRGATRFFNPRLTSVSAPHGVRIGDHIFY